MSKNVPNKTEKSFSPIGCAINDHGLYGLYDLYRRFMYNTSKYKVVDPAVRASIVDDLF